MRSMRSAGSGTEIGQRIAARIIIVRIPANKGPKVEHRIRTENASIGRRDIEGFNLGLLVGVSNIVEDRVRSGAPTDHVRDVQVVVGIRCLKP